MNKKLDGSYLFKIAKLMESHKFKNTPSFYDSIKGKGFKIIGELKKMDLYNDFVDYEFDFDSYAKEMSEFASALCIITEDGLMGDVSFVSQYYNSAQIPIIMRDIIVNPIQIFEAKELGASAITLLMSIISRAHIRHFIQQAKSLQIDVIAEASNIREIELAIEGGAKIFSINLYNDFFDEEKLADLYKYLPAGALKIAHSYIDSFRDIKKIKEIGFDAVIISNFFVAEQRKGIYKILAERIDEI